MSGDESFILVMSAIGLSALIIFLIIKICRKFLIFDRSGGRKIHSGQVGRLGGAGITAAFFAVSAVTVDPADFPEVSIPMLMLAFMIIFFMGLYDDIKGMRARIKFPLQIAASAIAVYSGINLHFTGLLTGGLISIPNADYFLSAVWILAFMNAVNLIDGMDGLSSGLVIIALFFFAAVGYQSGNEALIALSLILLGSTAGFYLFNFPPAKIFMGDAGAYSIGFVLAVMMPLSFNSQADLRMITFPAVVLLVPFLDVLQVIFRRIFLKKAIFSADNNHIHHKLLASGYNTREVLMLVYPVAAIFGFLGILHWENGNNINIALMALTVLICMFSLYWISDLEKKTEKLSAILEPGFKWCEYQTRYYPRGVQTSIVKHNEKKYKMYGDIHEISTCGLFFSTVEDVSVGDNITAVIVLGQRRPMHIKARIVSVSSGDGQYPAGFDCVFINAGYMARKKIRYHLLSVKAEVRRKGIDDKPYKQLKVIPGRASAAAGK